MRSRFGRLSVGGALRRRWRAHRAAPHSLTTPIAVAAVLAIGGHGVAAALPTRPAPLAVRPFAERTYVTEGPFRVGTGTAARAVRVAAPRVPPRASRSSSRTWVRPAYGPLTSRFGPRWGRMHEGIDIGAPHGAPVYAAASGVIMHCATLGGYGKLLLVQHAGGVVTAYGHLSRYVRCSGRVAAGEVIARVGSTGHATGPHLHFEIRVRGIQVNPLQFLRKRGVRI